MLDNPNNLPYLKSITISRIFKLKCSSLSHTSTKIKLQSLLKQYPPYQAQS